MTSLVMYHIIVNDPSATVEIGSLEVRGARSCIKCKSSGLWSFRRLVRQHTRLYTNCTQFVKYLLKSYYRRAVCGFCFFFSSHRMLGLLVFVVEYKFVFGNVMSANIGQSVCGDERFGASEDGAINAACGDVAGAARWEEAAVTNHDSCGTLSEHWQKCEGMMHAMHFSAVVVNGENLIR